MNNENHQDIEHQPLGEINPTASTILFTGHATSGTVSLSDSIDHYDAIYFQMMARTGRRGGDFVPRIAIGYGQTRELNLRDGSNSNGGITYTVNNSNSVSIHSFAGGMSMIVGVKF